MKAAAAQLDVSQNQMRFVHWVVIAGVVSCDGAPQPEASTAAAQSGAPTACLDTALTTQGMRECLSARLDSTDRRIAQLLDSARRTVASPAAVDAAQAAWLGYRSAQCQAEGAEYAGGTMESLAILGCHQSLGTDRVHVLQAQLGALMR